MTKAELIEKAKAQGLEVDEKMTKAQIEEMLDCKPAQPISEPKGPKSKYEDHAKFQKFKRGDN